MAEPLSGIRACVFDAYGTLFDYASEDALDSCGALLRRQLASKGVETPAMGAPVAPKRFQSAAFRYSPTRIAAG